MKNYKASTKFWLGVLFCIIVYLFIQFETYINWEKVINFLIHTIAAIIEVIFIILQIAGIVLLLGLDDLSYDDESIYEQRAENLPATKIGYIQIPVMLVKFIKHFNNWLNEKF